MTLWTVRCGGDGAYEQEAVAQKIVGIGWGDLGDISKINTREELMLHFTSTLPNEIAKGAEGNTWDQAFQAVYGISWAEGANYLGQILAAEYAVKPIKKS